MEEAFVPRGESATFRGLIALNKSDGSLAWKKHTVEPPSSGAAIWSTLSIDEATGTVFAATGNNYTPPASSTSDAFLALPLANGADFLWTNQILEGDVFTSRQSNGNPEADFGANPILLEVGDRKLAAGGNKGGDIWVLDRESGTVIAQRNVSAGARSRAEFSTAAPGTAPGSCSWSTRRPGRRPETGSQVGSRR